MGNDDDDVLSPPRILARRRRTWHGIWCTVMKMLGSPLPLFNVVKSLLKMIMG
jgi:hypothetical protein